MHEYPMINIFKEPKNIKISKYIVFLIISTIISSLIDTHFTIEKTPIPQMNSDTETIKPLIIISIILIITSIVKVVFTILGYFIFFYIVSSIFRQDVDKKDIFISSILLVTLIYITKTVVLIIQYITNINTIDYNIASLNIIDPGNSLLESINIILVIKTYIIALILKYTINFKNNLVIITIFIYLAIIIGFQVFKYTL